MSSFKKDDKILKNAAFKVVAHFVQKLVSSEPCGRLKTVQVFGMNALKLNCSIQLRSPLSNKNAKWFRGLLLRLKGSISTSIFPPLFLYIRWSGSFIIFCDDGQNERMFLAEARAHITSSQKSSCTFRTPLQFHFYYLEWITNIPMINPWT